MIRIAELAPLAQINVESLAEFGFFTWLIGGDHSAPFLPPSEYWLDVYEGLLTLSSRCLWPSRCRSPD